MRWVRHITRMGVNTNIFIFLCVTLKERDHLEDVNMYGTVYVVTCRGEG
jgi:hypothetical protein